MDQRFDRPHLRPHLFHLDCFPAGAWNPTFINARACKYAQGQDISNPDVGHADGHQIFDFVQPVRKGTVSDQ